jgi:ParB/RepB/Spo0J family partition protein
MKQRLHTRGREFRELDNLVPHTLQPDYFDELSEADLKLLADDIRKNGLQQPIEILPENVGGYAVNTIVSGHQRRRALKLLGETVAEVVVRYDLAGPTSDEIEKAFLSANLARRQLDTLAKARSVLRLFELEKGRAREEKLWPLDQREARDRIGHAIGLSGRTLSRYFRVLATPREVQDAFRRGKVSLVAAEKVADLDD